MSLRYSTIHHDVREEFELTISQYMVIDSIAQLSNTSHSNMSNVKRSKFLGIDEWSVRNGKQVGVEKGLLIEDKKGWHSTPKWNEAVSFTSGKSREVRENPEKNSGKSRDSIIIYNNKVTAAKADFQIEEETPSKPRSKKESGTKRYDELIEWLRNETGAPLRDVGKQYRWLKLAKERGFEVGDLKEHALKLWDNSFYKVNGMDWATVVQSMDKTTV